VANDGAKPNPDVIPTAAQFCTFFVNGLFFGVDVLSVQEVLCSQPMTRVPQAPEVIEGLINLRGQIVAAIDLRRRLELPPRAGNRPAMNLVVHAAEGQVSLLVDEIGDVVNASADSYEQPPENLEAAACGLIRGVYKLKGRLLLILDVERTANLGVAAAV
jgi:purine-binding chemotaxis protein CheW